MGVFLMVRIVLVWMSISKINSVSQSLTTPLNKAAHFNALQLFKVCSCLKAAAQINESLQY